MNSNLEGCFIEIKPSLIVGSLYRPPNTDVKEFLSDYSTLTRLIKNTKNKSCIIGLDHNLDLLKHHLHPNTQLFMEQLMEYNQFPCITRPTRITTTSATLIDNIIVSRRPDRQTILWDNHL